MSIRTKLKINMCFFLMLAAYLLGVEATMRMEEILAALPAILGGVPTP